LVTFLTFIYFIIVNRRFEDLRSNNHKTCIPDNYTGENQENCLAFFKKVKYRGRYLQKRAKM